MFSSVLIVLSILIGLCLIALPIVAVIISLRLIKKRSLYTCTVVSNDNVATFIKELIVTISDGKKMAYLPGHYMEIEIPPYHTHTRKWAETMAVSFQKEWERLGLFNGEINRLSCKIKRSAYSLASFPDEKELRFNVRIVPPLEKSSSWGEASSYLFSLKPGDTLRMKGPCGKTFLTFDKRPAYFLIGGVGSSFARSLIMHFFYHEKTSREVHLWYGARSLKEVVYREEFEALALAFPHFHYHLVLSEPTVEDQTSGWSMKDPTKTQYLFRAFEEGALKKMEAPARSLYYICGPFQHNQSCLRLLKAYGVPKENILIDDFKLKRR